MLTFSSPLTPPAFASFTVQLSNAQAVDQLRDESQLRYAISVMGSGVRAAHANLKVLETRVLLNGEPSMTLDGHLVAAAIGQGELVQVVLDLYQRGAANNKETVTVVGIITNVVFTAATAPMAQRVDLVLHRCHRLHVRAGGSVTTESSV